MVVWVVGDGLGWISRKGGYHMHGVGQSHRGLAPLPLVRSLAQRGDAMGLHYTTHALLQVNLETGHADFIDEWYIWQVQDWRFAVEESSWDEGGNWVGRTMSAV